MTQADVTGADMGLVQDIVAILQQAPNSTPLEAAMFAAAHRIAARNAALEEAAKVAEWSHMVPPDGGSPSEDECRVASEAAAAIRALMTMEDK